MYIFLNKLHDLLTKEDKRYLVYLFLFTIAIAGIETIGVSVIMPFLSVASDTSLITSNKYYHNIYNLFQFQHANNFVIIFGIVILFFYLIRAIINSLYVYLIIHFINTRYDSMVNKLFKTYLSIPYKNYTKQNSSSLTKVIINEAANITELLWFSLTFLSEALVFLFVYSVLMYINYKITIGISLILLFIGIFLKVVISDKMKFYGMQREEYQKYFYETLNRSFNNIKMIKLHSNNNAMQEFSAISQKYAKTKIMATSLQQFPRFIFELTGFSLVIIIVLFYIINNSANNHLFSIVSVFVLGLYRILPSVTRMFLSYNTILFQYKSLDIIHTDLNLDTEILGDDPTDFKEAIELNNICFSYDFKDVFKNLTLKISKNDKIAFIGESGGGKSTLVDIIMGLHQVNDGDIYVDKIKLTNENLKSWRNKFGYIPQSVYLFDGTVAENVAFGSTIDESKIIECLTKANIYEFLKSKNGIDTKVGESGVMLSGGQKQRIAIARALYQDPNILVLDEATSALDNDTEAKIMDEIYDITQDKTLIVIAHRLSTISKCNKVYQVENGTIQDVL